MAKKRKSNSGGVGKLTCRPEPDDGLIPRTLGFIREQLTAWRDDPTRAADVSEKMLNSSLSIFLEHQARLSPGFPMAHFVHESLQKGNRSADIGVHSTNESVLIGVIPYSKYIPFLVIEAKRLPTNGKEREREYVTGTTASGSATGGIQRFKLGLHGHGVETAAMVGYIQENTPQHWHKTINQWIKELAQNKGNSDCDWNDIDLLQKQEGDDAEGLTSYFSNHARTGNCVRDTISIHHFWISMSR